GHSYEMMDASGTTAEFQVSRVPMLGPARRLAARGVAPDGSRGNVRNLTSRAERDEGVTDDDFLLLCDSQTAGGLLVARPESEAERYALACRRRGAVSAAVVGRVLPRGEKLLKIVK